MTVQTCRCECGGVLGDLPAPRHRPTLSVTEAGRIIGLSRTAANARVKDGTIPSLRFGQRLMVPTAHLYALLGIESGLHR